MINLTLKITTAVGFLLAAVLMAIGLVQLMVFLQATFGLKVAFPIFALIAFCLTSAAGWVNSRIIEGSRS